MKIATNVHRDAFGGITISNLALFDWLKDTDDTVIGIEIVTSRHFLGAVIFRHYLPSFFTHHIINGIDIIPKFSWEKRLNPKKKWNILIETAKDILRKEAPDVLLINGTYHTPWIIAQAAKELGIPMVLRYAGILQREVTHKKFFVRKRLLQYEKWLTSNASAVIFPSDICRKTVEREILGSPLKNGIIIPNPVEKQKSRIIRKKRRYTIASIGRWTPIKNFQAFIDLHTQLLTENWSHRAMMVTSYWDKNFIFPDTIEKVQSMAHQDILDFYYSIDLLVVTSNFETFCNVAAEAVVHGTSVLVSKNVGFSEILVKAGLKRMVIDSFEDPVEVAQAVKKLSKIKLSHKELQKVLSLLNPALIHQRIVQVLTDVIL